MTIQPSIAVWTVICFFVLYFILKKLLFEPVLKVMDEREKKINGAKNAADDARTQAEEKRRLFLSEQEQSRQQLAAEQEKKAEKLRSEVRVKLEEAKKESFASVEDHRIRTESEYEAEMRDAQKRIDGAADLFLSCIHDS